MANERTQSHCPEEKRKIAGNALVCFGGGVYVLSKKRFVLLHESIYSSEERWAALGKE